MNFTAKEFPSIRQKRVGHLETTEVLKANLTRTNTSSG